jgi:hypothetical protein
MSYGNARLILNPDAMQRSTVTFADSLSTDGRVLPRPAGAMAWDAYEFPSYGAPLPAEWSDETRAFFQEQMQARDPLAWQSLADYQQLAQHHDYTGASIYVEMQIHGGVRVSDIKEIVFTGHEPPSDALTQRLDAAGIPWRHDAAQNPWLRAATAEIDDTGPASPFEE